MEPTKHQYDYSSEIVHGFLVRNGLEGQFKLNIEANHATLAGHSFHHEIAYAVANGVFGSIDANRGDPQNGWDTDQFPNSVEDLVLPIYEIFRSGGFTNGGFNFDSKLRRQSIDRIDLFHAHIGGMDAYALAFKLARRILADGKFEQFVTDRYSSFDTGYGKDIETGKATFKSLEKLVLTKLGEPKLRSGLFINTLEG